MGTDAWALMGQAPIALATAERRMMEWAGSDGPGTNETSTLSPFIRIGEIVIMRIAAQ